MPNRIYTIGLVEDEKPIRDLVSEILMTGFSGKEVTIRQYGDIYAAYMDFSKSKFDFIVSDFRVPPYAPGVTPDSVSLPAEGLHLLAYAISRKAVAGPRQTLLMSGNVHSDNLEEKAAKYGIPVLAKPIDFDALVNQVRLNVPGLA